MVNETESYRFQHATTVLAGDKLHIDMLRIGFAARVLPVLSWLGYVGEIFKEKEVTSGRRNSRPEVCKHPNIAVQ